MTKTDGGPAFPGTHTEHFVGSGPWPDREAEVSYPGMSLRDWFAGQALAGILARGEGSSRLQAQFAYETADAMLAERSK